MGCGRFSEHVIASNNRQTLELRRRRGNNTDVTDRTSHTSACHDKNVVPCSSFIVRRRCGAQRRSGKYPSSSFVFGKEGRIASLAVSSVACSSAFPKRNQRTERLNDDNDDEAGRSEKGEISRRRGYLHPNETGQNNENSFSPFLSLFPSLW